MNSQQFAWLLKLLLGLSRHFPAKKQLEVLIVEDSPEDAELIANYVKEAGGDPVIVKTLEGALDLLNNRKFRMVFLDVRFTTGCGIEFTRHFIRPRFPKLPLVFVTGEASQLMRLPPGRCWQFILKGSDGGSLMEAIREAISAANGLNGQMPTFGVSLVTWMLMTASVLLGVFLKNIAHLLK